MSETASVSPKVVAYLTQQLSRNPQTESGEIIASRAQAFRLEEPSAQAAAPARSPDQRQQIRAQLEKIREGCFTGPAEPMLVSLEAMELDDFPDLAKLAWRLRVILESRGELPALTADPKFDGDFFSCLKKVLVSPPREVSVLREQVVASFAKRKQRRRGQAMVRLIKEHMRGLYTLEKDWFDSLLAMRSFYWVSPAGSPGAESSSNLGAWIVAIWIGLISVGGLFATLDDKESTPKSTPQFSAPYTIENSRIDPVDSLNTTAADQQLQQQQRIDEIRREQDERIRDATERHRRFVEEMEERRRQRGFDRGRDIGDSTFGPRPVLPGASPPKRDSENPFDVDSYRIEPH